MFPPRGDYPQEQRQHKGRNPHRERMRIKNEVSENSPSRRVKYVRGEACADRKSVIFETHLDRGT